MHLSHSPQDPPAQSITFEQFLAVDIRIGTILQAEILTEVRKPALRAGYSDQSTGNFILRRNEV